MRPLATVIRESFRLIHEISFSYREPYFYRSVEQQTPEECVDNAAKHLERLIQYEGPNSILRLCLRVNQVMDL
jgi:hypothetical protein